MRTPVDLHPNDLAARERLAADLRAAREAAGMGQQTLAQNLGVGQAAVSRMERRATWRTCTVYSWARAVHRTAVMYLDRVAVTGSTDTVRCRSAVARLTVIRVATRISDDAMAAALDVTPQAVRLWESYCDNPLLCSIQRYARVLGVRVNVRLEVA